ncbi:L7Ae/L30e/S12e/Gadd45 family ribosomal protein [Gracilibacillus alcaliphilus]|uniref:L7Ae/L30e/S12e/Gadd45 family ribosomal protein n=1 Tax=Gracilibacillus alcaliphilus TaxID=1401441 RepID=UPI00195760F2|nr:ribosomal L7Ae/L30e/S12e/Gadd45 family protein [Gracilibacillus alcaliphilus]MBM7677974.1 ribosomal protein L7Ae-like RNA K-turn-binding protein [Gracilibacillus alcaliphilus]
MAQQKSYLNLLGIATRAGKCTFGEEQIVKEIQSKKSKLVLIASDIGDQTRKKLTDKCTSYQIPVFFVDDRDTLSQAVGKSGRVAVSIHENGFAKKLIALLDENIRR